MLTRPPLNRNDPPTHLLARCCGFTPLPTPKKAFPPLLRARAAPVRLMRLLWWWWWWVLLLWWRRTSRLCWCCWPCRLCHSCTNRRKYPCTACLGAPTHPLHTLSSRKNSTAWSTRFAKNPCTRRCSHKWSGIPRASSYRQSSRCWSGPCFLDRSGCTLWIVFPNRSRRLVGVLYGLHQSVYYNPIAHNQVSGV